MRDSEPQGSAPIPAVCPPERLLVSTKAPAERAPLPLRPLPGRVLEDGVPGAGQEPLKASGKGQLELTAHPALAAVRHAQVNEDPGWL